MRFHDHQARRPLTRALACGRVIFALAALLQVAVGSKRQCVGFKKNDVVFSQVEDTKYQDDDNRPTRILREGMRGTVWSPDNGKVYVFFESCGALRKEGKSKCRGVRTVSEKCSECNAPWEEDNKRTDDWDIEIIGGGWSMAFENVSRTRPSQLKKVKRSSSADTANVRMVRGADPSPLPHAGPSPLPPAGPILKVQTAEEARVAVLKEAVEALTWLKENHGKYIMGTYVDTIKELACLATPLYEINNLREAVDNLTKLGDKRKKIRQSNKKEALGYCTAAYTALSNLTQAKYYSNLNPAQIEDIGRLWGKLNWQKDRVKGILREYPRRKFLKFVKSKTPLPPSITTRKRETFTKHFPLGGKDYKGRRLMQRLARAELRHSDAS